MCDFKSFLGERTEGETFEKDVFCSFNETIKRF